LIHVKKLSVTLEIHWSGLILTVIGLIRLASK